jgi:hypothetical protein
VNTAVKTHMLESLNLGEVILDDLGVDEIGIIVD